MHSVIGLLCKNLIQMRKYFVSILGLLMLFVLNQNLHVFLLTGWSSCFPMSLCSWEYFLNLSGIFRHIKRSDFKNIRLAWHSHFINFLLGSKYFFFIHPCWFYIRLCIVINGVNLSQLHSVFLFIFFVLFNLISLRLCFLLILLRDLCVILKWSYFR